MPWWGAVTYQNEGGLACPTGGWIQGNFEGTPCRGFWRGTAPQNWPLLELKTSTRNCTFMTDFQLPAVWSLKAEIRNANNFSLSKPPHVSVSSLKSPLLFFGVEPSIVCRFCRSVFITPFFIGILQAQLSDVLQTVNEFFFLFHVIYDMTPIHLDLSFNYRVWRHGFEDGTAADEAWLYE